MKRHLNTLFVTTQGTYLFKDGETLAVKVEDTVRLRVPIHTWRGLSVSVRSRSARFCSGFAPKTAFP